MIRQIPLPFPHDAAMGVDDFLITSSNREATSWIDRWPEWPTHGLIITGPSGSGKTHLLNVWLTQSKGKRVSSDELLALDWQSLTSTTSALAIDDADSLATHSDWEEKLFHLYNHLQTIQGSLLLTMRQGVGQTAFQLPDLRSRLLTLSSTSLGVPDDDLLAALIVKQFRDRQIALDAGVVAYMVARTPRDAAGVRNLVEQLDHAALAEGRKITIALARRVLEDSHV